MDTMRAIVYTDNLPVSDERAFVDVELPTPAPGPHDLLVEVRAVSINPVDVKQRAKAKPPAEGRVLGYDGAGIVRAVGSAVELFGVGDEVYYAGAIDRPGSNSEYQLVDERIVGLKPANLDFADAAALPLTTVTAWEALFDKLKLHDASRGTLLVVGASGGVGSMMLQLVDALLPNVTVIGTASRPEAVTWEEGFGVTATVNHREDLVAQVRAVAPGGVDWIFTSHSTGQLANYVELLKPFGEIVAIDDPGSLDAPSLKNKSLSWHWEYMFAKSLHGAANLVSQHEALDEVAGLVNAGRIVTTATVRLSPLDAATLREAHRLVEAGDVIGKVVVSGWPR
jgi:zinc-binding alcohol dehydrogenase family protein